MDAGELLMHRKRASAIITYIHMKQAGRWQQVCTRQANKQRRYKSSTKKMKFQFKRMEGETGGTEQKVKD